ncbi:TetR family transcriptional regulator [Paraliobacillus quinghaiensis]|uniref:TetR family transcriptional regulator n=1 Tax=Paraliobacillus quinghaiensis TaxID=470815 RepID=A0A917TRF5_9BACI|nr:TetR/AcrR family transcriptional regulator [Paraliobacillus quinghaiensis]GGM33956.1 TetR family transcriptional regulator [Paraliobacillus quinghaiensis]
MDKIYIKQLLESEGDEVKLTEKKAAILVAAIEIFAEKGYAATSTSEIAKQAGVAEGTIFRHYASKKELLLAIVKPGIMKLAIPYFASQVVEDVFGQGNNSFEDILREFIYNRIDFAKKNVPMIRIILQEIAFHTEMQQALKSTFLSEVYPKVEELIVDLQQKGHIKSVPIDTTIRFIITTVLGFILHQYIFSTNATFNEEVEVEHVIDLIMDGIQKS